MAKVYNHHDEKESNFYRSYRTKRWENDDLSWPDFWIKKEISKTWFHETSRPAARED